jgi:hypothetical protein
MTYKEISAITKKASRIRFKNEPTVLVPLKEWYKIEEGLEDLEALSSIVYIKKIKRARQEMQRGQITSLEKLFRKER